MIVTLKNADFSTNNIGNVISGHVVKNSSTVGFCVLSDNFQNGRTLFFKLKIDSIGSIEDGTTINFDFGTSSTGTVVNGYMQPYPIASLAIHNGSEYSGQINTNGLTEERIYTMFSIMGATNAMKTILFTVDFEYIDIL